MIASPLGDTSTSFMSKYSLVIPSAISSLTKAKSATALGTSYEPGDHDIVCGRGKGCYNRLGNKRFRTLVNTYIPQYVSTKSRLDKSMILSSIIEKVRSLVNTETGQPAQFVKYKKHIGWTEIGDEQAREKVGHTIREAIAARECAFSVKTETKLKLPDRTDFEVVPLSQQQTLLLSSLGQQRASFSNKLQITALEGALIEV